MPQVIMELNLASMGLVVMEYMMTQQVERKERTAQIPNLKLVGGPDGKHVPAPTVKIVKEGAPGILAKETAHLPHARLWQSIWQDLTPTGTLALAYRRETIHVYLVILWETLHTFG